MNIALHASTVLPSLADLGTQFDALTAEYDVMATLCSGLIAETDKDLADAGIAYGSTEWSCQRFAKCGKAIRSTDGMQMDVEELALLISRHPATSLEDLAIRPRRISTSGRRMPSWLTLQPFASATPQRPDFRLSPP
jgi:hypothetical protein